MHTVHAHTDVSGLYLCVQLEAYSLPPPQYSPALLSLFFYVSLETQGLLMETRKRLLTTLTSMLIYYSNV